MAGNCTLHSITSINEMPHSMLLTGLRAASDLPSDHPFNRIRPDRPPLELLFIGSLELPESPEIATLLASQLGPRRIHLAYLAHHGYLDSVDLAAYDGVYLYTSNQDACVEHLYGESTFTDTLILPNSCLILVEASPANSAFIRNKSLEIPTGRYAYTIIDSQKDGSVIEDLFCIS